MKLHQLLFKVRQELRRDARIILAHLLRVRVSDTYLLEEEELKEDILIKFAELMKRREEGMPVAYLIGEWDFFGRTFKVSEGVLIPRPETEFLVEKVLGYIPEDARWEGLEIGTGTGCVAVTLLLERSKLKMTATDINPKALNLARENAKAYNVSDRLFLLEGDLFEPVKGRKFHFIVSNPPYIPENAWESLPEEVRREGKVSLIGGVKGYEFAKRLIGEVRDFLLPGGFLALEIGHDQGKVVAELMRSAGLNKVNIYKDYAGRDRVAVGWNL